ncbi:TetR/AcrR family transcriptional regulator [Lentilactobacillus hilgardii]|nr:TetR/AcrR family transcriptional regulator [Lentilactobacillus hilgardii]MCV3741326.1 TetR/AcrR family transcriptional regulator [Lentilactobacillus hilgardii]
MDKRVIKTKSALREALFKLLQSKPITKITVSKLCQQAQINRRTFYIHYSRVSEIFDDYEIELSEKVSKALSKNHTDAKELLITFDSILMKNFEGFRYLCLDKQHQQLIDDLKSMLFHTMCDVLFSQAVTKRQQLILQYVANGLVDSYIYWFKHEDEIDFQTLVKTNKQLLNANLSLL